MSIACRRGMVGWKGAVQSPASSCSSETELALRFELGVLFSFSQTLLNIDCHAAGSHLEHADLPSGEGHEREGERHDRVKRTRRDRRHAPVRRRGEDDAHGERERRHHVLVRRAQKDLWCARAPRMSRICRVAIRQSRDRSESRGATAPSRIIPSRDGSELARVGQRDRPQSARADDSMARRLNDSSVQEGMNPDRRLECTGCVCTCPATIQS